MFETKHVPVYLDGMAYKTLKVGKDKYKATKLTLRIDPLTPELAAELDDTKGVLFRRNDAEVNGKIKAVEFTYVPKAQAIEFRPDPQLPASITLAECKVEKFKVRKENDGGSWVLTFHAITPDISGGELLYLKDALFEQRFLTFENSKPGLFDEEERERRRESRAAKPVSAGGAGVTAH